MKLLPARINSNPTGGRSGSAGRTAHFLVGDAAGRQAFEGDAVGRGNKHGCEWRSRGGIVANHHAGFGPAVSVGERIDVGDDFAVSDHRGAVEVELVGGAVDVGAIAGDGRRVAGGVVDSRSGDRRANRCPRRTTRFGSGLRSRRRRC